MQICLIPYANVAKGRILSPFLSKKTDILDGGDPVQPSVRLTIKES